MKINERKNVIEYLKKRQLEKPYLKAKKLLEQEEYRVVDFKLRKPKSRKIFYFRVTKKYRALGHFIDDIFVVTEISDHQ